MISSDIMWLKPPKDDFEKGRPQPRSAFFLLPKILKFVSILCNCIILRIFESHNYFINFVQLHESKEANIIFCNHFTLTKHLIFYTISIWKTL